MSLRILMTATVVVVVLPSVGTDLSGQTPTPTADKPAPAAAPTKRDPLPDITRANWIWGAAATTVCEFRTTITLDRVPTAAGILITADNGYELYVNGSSVGFDVGAGAEIWNSLEYYDVRSRLAQGRNVIGVRGICLGGKRAVIAGLRIQLADGSVIQQSTDASWHVAPAGDPAEYSHPEFLEDENWTTANVLGPMGMAPWGHLTYQGSQGGRRVGRVPASVQLSEPGPEFRWPQAVAFVAGDCSVYTPLRGDAWGVCFRVGNWSRAYTEFDLPCPSKIGRQLCVLRPAGRDTEPRVLIDAGKGVLGSPAPTYDGRAILLAMAPEGDAFFHIYRVDRESGRLQQLTSGPFHDIDPCQLPDNRIVFTSTRSGTFEEYHNPPSRALFTMQPDGTDIRPLTFTPSFDNEPHVMADGRIAFVRTDNFFDRAKVETQIHIIRPDGTSGLSALAADLGVDYGVRLRAWGYGSPAPLPDGRLAVISNHGNLICRPGAADAMYDRLPDGLGDLAAMPDGRLLVTVLRPRGMQVESDVLGVVDPRDNRVVRIYDAPHGSIHSPIYLGRRPRPPVLANRVDRQADAQPDSTGFLFCRDARFTRNTKADWNRIRAIRVLAAKALTVRSSHSHIVHAGHETVELGTVPIGPDGSFYVEVPANIPLALQAVDAEGRSELNEMSWIYVRPGEQRSCVGCHQPRRALPRASAAVADAMRSAPLKLTGQGDPHRFRGNNPGVTGMMDLQFERFRETASLNLITDRPQGDVAEVPRLIEQLQHDDTGLRISAARRLAIWHDRQAAGPLARCLGAEDRQLRVAAALALAACGTRDSVPPLLNALSQAARRDCVEYQAMAVALENLTGHAEPAATPWNSDAGAAWADAWTSWWQGTSWEAIEASLIVQLEQEDRSAQQQAAVTLGHIAGPAGRRALRRYVAGEIKRHPYPAFEKNNRTDRFTFGADSPWNPRPGQEAVRALGYLGDTESVGLLEQLLREHREPRDGNLFLFEAALDALARVPSSRVDELLQSTAAGLQDYVHYVGWYSDHPALYACHASPLHARLLAALDYRATVGAASMVPSLIRSVPTDPDRALFPQNDTYEVYLGRVIRRSGAADRVIETCLALLGDPRAVADGAVERALRSSYAAWAGKPAADNRAAQILSAVCRSRQFEPRIRAAYERYRSRPEDPVERPLGNPSWIPQRHWVLFYLGRALGNLRDARSVDTLIATLDGRWCEARHGRPDPDQPNIHFLQLEYTPCWRAAAAWALGRIGDRRAQTALWQTVTEMENAPDTRHAAAVALTSMADAAMAVQVGQLAGDYPDVATRRVLLQCSSRAATTAKR